MTLRAEDAYQKPQDFRDRNLALAGKLNGAWNDKNIIEIKREKIDETNGAWVATTA